MDRICGEHQTLKVSSSSHTTVFYRHKACIIKTVNKHKLISQYIYWSLLVISLTLGVNIMFQ